VKICKLKDQHIFLRMSINTPLNICSIFNYIYFTVVYLITIPCTYEMIQSMNCRDLTYSF